MLVLPSGTRTERGTAVASWIDARVKTGQSALVEHVEGASRDRQLMRLGATIVLGALQPEQAVGLATALVAAGSDCTAAVELASMPSDPKRLSIDDVEPLARRMLADFGVELPSRSGAGWTVARFIAEAMIAGAIDPPTGALRLWSLWRICGEPGDELTWMLQLHDAWEQAVGERRAAIERKMVEYAPAVVAAAETHGAA